MRLLLLYIVCVSLLFFAGLLFVLQEGTDTHDHFGLSQTLAVISKHKEISLGRGVHYLIDPELPVDMDVIRVLTKDGWQLYEEKTINLGNWENSVWLHFSMRNELTKPVSAVLELGWPFLRNIGVFTRDHDIKSGQQGASSDRFVQLPEMSGQRHPSFLLTLSAKSETEICIYLESSAKLIAPLTVWDFPLFKAHESKVYMWLASFLSAVTVMLFYNFFLYFFTRDRSYLFYCFYVCSVLFYVVAFTGLGGKMLWPENEWLQDHVYGLSSSFSFLVVVFFMRSFLSLRTVGGWPLQVSNILAVSWLLIVFGYIFTPASLIILFEDLMAIVSCCAGLATTIYLWWKGNVSAKYLAIAWTILIVATILLMLGLTNITSYTPVSQYVQMFGFVVEVVLISIALAERINRERTQKEDAQQRALHMSRKMQQAQNREMVAQSELLQLKENANLELENRVKQRTRELHKAMQALEEANHELAEISITDPLTKLANRRYYEQVLEKETQRARRAGAELSLMVVDIDHFKQLNDTYGHLAGDHCLVVIAQTIRRKVVRPSDFVARFGGEEFVVVLPETNMGQAKFIAEKIRMACCAASIRIEDATVHLTVSIGVATLGAGSAYDPKQLFEDADQALYQAKNGGRNQSVAIRSQKK